MYIIEIAVIPNSNEVHIYKYEPNFSDWTLLDNLDQHGLLITGIDWAPNTNRIVTCSAVSVFMSFICLFTTVLIALFDRTATRMYGQSMTRENGNQLLYCYGLVERRLVLNGRLMVILLYYFTFNNIVCSDKIENGYKNVS